MKADSILCPNCSTSIELTEALLAQVRSKVVAENQSRFNEQQAKLDQQRNAVAAERAAAQADRDALQQEKLRNQAEITQQVEKLAGAERARLAKESAQSLEAGRKQMEQAAAERAAAAVEAKLKSLEKASQEHEDYRKKSIDAELALRQQLQLATRQAQEAQLIAAKEMDDQREAIREQAAQQEAEKFRLERAESNERLATIQRQLEEANRKIQQGSTQTQGEALELELERWLKECFPEDRVEPVSKGERGGDIVHTVVQRGRACGSIVWEAKRTKAWSDKWLAKLREDQRECKADLAVIVSVTLPEGISHMGEIEGVWVSSVSAAKGTATALRSWLIEVAETRVAAEGQVGKAQAVYQYLVGPRFRHRMQAVVESMTAIERNLADERKAMNKLWSTREAQIRLAIEQTVGVLGDVQGIAGASIPEIESVELKALAERSQPL